MTPALLGVRDVHKRFGGVQALDGVGLSIGPGEVHALLGENGAGKSTLIKILSGALAFDSGAIVLAGRALSAQDSPSSRRALGVATIYQEFSLVPGMSVAENLFLGCEPLRLGLIDRRSMNAQAGVVLARLGQSIPPDTPVSHLTVATQQMVEIARALTLDASLIIMDEPTAALSDREVDQLHAVIRGLKADGVSVLYVTHRLSEVKAVCDRYTVLRDGRLVASGEVKDATLDTFVTAMVGRELSPPVRRARPSRPVALRIEGVCRTDGAGPALHDVGLTVREGEILGLAGLVGSGRTELARTIFGADAGQGGVLWLDGARRDLFRSPAEAMRAGLAALPEDRQQHGCFLDHRIRWNLSLPSLPGLSRFRVFVDESAERAIVASYMDRLRIRAPGGETAIGDLSGGNQQKVLLARCMALRPRILIVDEPTRGVDVGAKGEVHQILFDLAGTGVAVIVISSDMPELLQLSDRIVVLHEGRNAGEIARANANEVNLMKLMTGPDQQVAA